MFNFSARMSGEPVRRVEPALPGAMLSSTALGTGQGIGSLVLRLWRGAGVIVLGGTLLVVAAVATLGLLPPRYTSQIQILVDPADLRVVDNDVSARQPQADSGVSVAESQVRVIQSDSVLRRVVGQLHLERDDEFVRPDSADPRLTWIKAALGMLTPRASREPVNLALDTLQTKLTVRRAERTFVIDVAVQSRDPEKAARIANAIGAAYIAENTSARTEAARRASEALEGRLNSLRHDVEQAEEQVLHYREEHHLVSSDGRLLTDHQLGDLNQQLVAAAIRAADARARWDQARRMQGGDGSTALPEMLKSPEMQALRQQEATLSRNIADLTTRLGARHPAMAEQYAQQRDLQQLIQRERVRIIETTLKDHERASASESAIRMNLDRVKRETAMSGRAYVGLRELERTLASRKLVYEAYLRRAREAREQERLDATNVRLISQATPARERTFPPSPRIVLPAALGLGLLLGAVATLLLPTGRRKRSRRWIWPVSSLRPADA